MKRHLNTSYRLVWNHITGTLVVASELARSRGKRAGVAIALSLAAVTSVPALAADTVVQAGETVSGGTLENHDNQIVFGTANGMTISTGLEYGPDNEANTGGQWIQNGGIANNTTVTGGGLQRVNAGGSVSDTVISAGGGQSLQGQAVNTTLNGGEQWVHEGGIATGTVINEKGWQAVKSGAVATDTVVNTGAEGGPDAENGDTGQIVYGDAVRTTINKNGRQIVAAEGTANTTVVYAGGDQTVHGYALDTTLDGGYQYVHQDGMALDTVINEGGWQVIKAGGAAGNTIVNQKGKLQVNAGSEATAVTQNTGGALVTSTAATVTGTNRLGAFSVVDGKADNIVLENGGRLDVLNGHSATDTRVDDGGTLAVLTGGTATTVSMGKGGMLLADSGATVSGQYDGGGAFSIGSGRASGLSLGQGSAFTLKAGGSARNTTVNGGQLTAQGGTLAGTTTLSDAATLTLSGQNVNEGTLRVEGDSGASINGDTGGGVLAGNGMVEKSGSGTLTVSNITLTQKTVNLNEGALTLVDSDVTTDVIARHGTALNLNGRTVLTGAVDPTDITLATGATWNIPDNATVKSVVDELSHAGKINFVSARSGTFTPATLTVKNLRGQNGSITLRVRPDLAENNADRLVIDGGRATGKTILNLVNAGNSASGLATSGKGIQVVEAINGATTEEGAFVQGNKLQAGAFNYSLNRESDESWYLRSEERYRAEVPLYASMLTQAMDYDRILAGSRSHQTGVNGENNSVRLSIQGGHLGHDNNGGIARGATPESNGSYGLVRLEGDLLRTEVAGMSVTAGVYGAAGHSSVDVKDDDGSRAGTVRDDAGSLGGYLNLVHTSSGLWADIVAQGTRHSMKASSDNNDFRARGWGWLGSLETGLPFSITDNLMLEPQLQYTWQGLSLDDGQDNAGYVKFGHGSAQHVRAGFRLGSHNDMTFGEGTSSRDTLRDSAKHSVSELPVNGWVQPSVIRTFSSRGDMSMGTAAAGSNMTFSPSRNGTSLDLQAGLEARVRENITLGVQAGYAHSVSGSSAEGYNGQATLNITF
ncbi:autotransporter adhesin Ag43 [Escherichia coli]|uniref:autotransporter adhesin Ag43 n=28 Tax=Escherichia coli TaxID=562 RepID=UPI0010A668ED|nr:autotransporter adhesin Ag43 [Escherichia coli]EFK7840912.1 autotransporter adhesin Ag43 [Escherichia coli]EGN9342147.1 autotransporter adhesin Ag43 [Escherichia coli]ELE7698187.1 autotransporter adhesin Ag43 [Escherichia coli]THG49911.1 autotransporter adhesin Ag43 [Escherichia coli]HEI3254030.1 autotransporter adhesin Ag43 [Escherichia coli]